MARKFVSPGLSILIFSLFAAAVLAHPACVGPGETQKTGISVNSFYGTGGFDVTIHVGPVSIPATLEASYVMLDPASGERVHCPLLVVDAGDIQYRGTSPSADQVCIDTLGVNPLLSAAESTFHDFTDGASVGGDVVEGEADGGGDSGDVNASFESVE